MKQYFFVALLISIFLGLIFSPSQVITIFFQGAYLVVVIIYVLLSVLIVIVSAVVYVITSLLISAINFIIEPDISTGYIIDIQSNGLKATYALYTSLVKFLYDTAVINANLFDLDIQFSHGQSVIDALNISITSLDTLFVNVLRGIIEPVETWIEKFLREHGVN
jgi:hypothetical protein